ncbi:MAG: GNAT family N-acetyltransferase [Clostridia bacterium]|nr:GNAT family N-acetyltransferase [Clostridia bacterium]
MIKVSALNDSNKQAFLNLIEKDFKNANLKNIEDSINSFSDNELLLVCLNEQNQAIGFAKTTEKVSAILKLDYIYVTKDLRRDKNGSVILVSVYNYAVNRLIAGIIGECNKNNEDAIAFFKARGFTVAPVDSETCSLTKSLLYMYKTHE